MHTQSKLLIQIHFQNGVLILTEVSGLYLKKIYSYLYQCRKSCNFDDGIIFNTLIASLGDFIWF